MRVLVVEDEAKLASLLRQGLRRHGVGVDVASTGDEALLRATATDYDAILLDVMLPGIDGLEVCRRLRALEVWSPTLMLTALDDVEYRVRGLDNGADDYLIKPFSFDELMARIRAALRRTGFATDTTPKKISVPGLDIDFEERRVVASGRAVRLTPTEFDILRYLTANANKPVPHRRLLQAIWGPEYGEQIEYLRVFINQLRKKIEPPGSKPTFITTEPRIGYRFVLEE